MATKSQREKRRRLRLLAAAKDEPLRIQGEGTVEFTAAKGGEGDEKKLPTFKMTAYTGGKMRPRGFTTPVVVDLATAVVASGSRPIFLDHNPTQIVGHGDITVGQTSIQVEGVMSGVGPVADGIKMSAANGFPWKSSIGADVGKLDFVEGGKQVTVNGRKFNGPLYVARQVEIYETSFVSLAGDNRSTATVAAGQDLGDTTMGFEAWLKAKGFDLAALSDEQKTVLKAAFDAEQKPEPKLEPKPTQKVEASKDGDDSDPVAQIRAEQAEEIKRIKSIRSICAEFPDLKVKAGGEELDLEAHAIKEGWTVQQAENYALRASRPAPAVHSRSHETDCTKQALQGALMLRAGLALDSKIWGTLQASAIGMPAWILRGLNDDTRQKAMEAAHRFAAMSMMDLCKEANRLDGKNPGYGRNEVIQAAFSGSALTEIFTTNINAVVLATYMETGDTTGGWTKTTDVGDFKTNERLRMAKGPSLAKLPRGQTADHATRSDTAEEYKIARYAKQFVVDEQDIIDDRFNALSDTPREMGLAAARLRPDLVYAILFANANLADGVALFDSATHANTNTSAALASDKLQAGITAIGIQRDNGVNLNLMPSHLIVPQTLKFKARELVNSSQIVIAGTAGSVTERGNINTLADEGLTIVSDSRLDNGVTDPATGISYSGDTNDWFLAAAMGHTIEVAYLAGTGRAPQVRSFQLDRGQWGIGWDVKMDIGTKALDYRALYRGQG